MVHCSKCGELLVDGAKFCDNCGSPIKVRGTHSSYPTKVDSQPTKEIHDGKKIKGRYLLFLGGGLYFFIVLILINEGILYDFRYELFLIPMVFIMLLGFVWWFIPRESRGELSNNLNIIQILVFILYLIGVWSLIHVLGSLAYNNYSDYMLPLFLISIGFIAIGVLTFGWKGALLLPVYIIIYLFASSQERRGQR